MSSYADYAHRAADYDHTRWAAGLEVILGCLACGFEDLSRITLLDAGCGTGNYARALCGRVGRIEALEIEPAMLARARGKLAEDERNGRVRFHRGSVLDMPLPDRSVDAVMANQMLHHLPPPGENALPFYRRVFAEFHRVLRSGGMLVVNSCLPHQLERGYWYSALIPQAVERLKRSFPPLTQLREVLAELGFRWGGVFVPLDLVLMGEAYFDPRGPLDPAWRAGDSTFALVDEEELRAMESRLRDLDRAGRLEGFFRERDAQRFEVGQFMIFHAQRN